MESGWIATGKYIKPAKHHGDHPQEGHSELTGNLFSPPPSYQNGPTILPEFHMILSGSDQNQMTLSSLCQFVIETTKNVIGEMSKADSTPQSAPEPIVDSFEESVDGIADIIVTPPSTPALPVNNNISSVEQDQALTDVITPQTPDTTEQTSTRPEKRRKTTTAPAASVQQRTRSG